MPRFFEGHLVSPKGRFAICVSRFNGFITEPLLSGALDALVRHGVSDGDIDVYRCPGTWELSGLVRRVADSKQYVGVIALEDVAGEVAKGVGQATLTADAAVTFGVLTTDSVEQAVDRAGVKAGNKGAEAAVACIEMVNLYARMGAK
jgi:6,7-dimethyl-8-ribityllumazine synthase